ncbi:unnamed protein product [Paramecium primaurelia]|uniref:Uncharacterized protein n=1 Tax=Paramecium primaurelia TaxID=5886 RepID=A0A8S1KCI8_PARPR|nr:unnamed protein product [Paramecium primaurelia]
MRNGFVKYKKKVQSLIEILQVLLSYCKNRLFITKDFIFRSFALLFKFIYKLFNRIFSHLIIFLFQIDAPLNTEIENKSLYENIEILIKDFLGEEEISKTSYEHYLKMTENDKVYKTKLTKIIG